MKKELMLAVFLVYLFMISGKILAEEKREAGASLCDPDGSKRVDGFDLGKLGPIIGSKQGDPKYDPKADCNKDGIIDKGDIEEIRKHFGEETIPSEGPGNTKRKGPKPPTGFRVK